MKIPREYRFDQNPLEKRIVREFLKDANTSPINSDNLGYFNDVALTKEMKDSSPYLNEREEMIILNTIQWLGSPVGRSFLEKCGFELKYEDVYNLTD